MIGRTVSHYKILEELGEGGMGVVYKAEDTSLKRTVALKFLPPDVLGSKEARHRLVTEARAAAALDHPHICTVYEIGEDREQLFISMAYVEGLSLKEKLRSGPLSLDEALTLTARIAEGLGAAHAKGIVHRDVKSANIMVTEEGQVKITDFGLAEVAGTSRPREGSEISGTLAYMSPEETRGEASDERADIWSLGVCLYEMLAGRLPFRGEYEQAIIYSILNEDPPALSALRPELPPAAEGLVRRALAKSRDARYQSMADFIADLRALGEELESGAADRAPSVAVLPFANLSPDQEQDYFCEGIAEDIINHLTRVEGLRVASRTAAFALRGRHADIRRIARELGAATLVDGSVRKAGNKLRITAHLVDVAQGYQVWSEQYDRELADVFAIQDEIARSIVQALKVELTEKDKRALATPATRDVEAFDYYLRGRKYFYQSKRRAIDFARRMFSRAIEKDPQYALAYAGLADCHSYLYMYFQHTEANLREATRASERALELDPELAEGHAARGLALSMSKHYDEAETEFKTAVRLHPQLFEAYYFYARTCFVQGKLAEAAELFERAEEVNPEGYQASILLAQTYRGLDRLPDMAAAYRRGLDRIEARLELYPDDSRAIYLGGAALIELGEGEKGLEWTRKAWSMDPDDPYTVYGVACAHSRLGDVEEAIDFVEKALRAGFAHKEWLDNDSDFDPIRDHPRFQELLRSLE